jgi:dTDP-4-dehydrorhamnose reductase
MQPKILIIGKGYVGNELSRLFARANNIFEHISRDELDYTDKDILTKYLTQHSDIAAVVNCSGYTGRPNVDAAETDKEKCLLLNLDTPINIYDVCEMFGIKYYHLSSGCIYTGYDKLWTEEDEPNFGVGCLDASWYSQTKHMAEKELAAGNNYIIRLRMPFTGNRPDGINFHDRDFLGKLTKYDRLVNTLNSKTHVGQVCAFIYELICRTVFSYNDRSEIFNYVCADPLDTKTVLEVLMSRGIFNPNWKIVDWKDLDLKANRSNCILSMQKAQDCGFSVYSELETLITSLDQ